MNMHLLNINIFKPSRAVKKLACEIFTKKEMIDSQIFIKAIQFPTYWPGRLTVNNKVNIGASIWFTLSVEYIKRLLRNE